nr:immunoglobulin light chain junction region [Macaca mulatta]MOW13751.1 immunoglobulin light chain junction region [Macaca mulatta]
CLQYLTTPFTF